MQIRSRVKLSGSGASAVPTKKSCEPTTRRHQMRDKSCGAVYGTPGPLHVRYMEEIQIFISFTYFLYYTQSKIVYCFQLLVMTISGYGLPSIPNNKKRFCRSV